MNDKILISASAFNLLHYVTLNKSMKKLASQTDSWKRRSYKSAERYSSSNHTLRITDLENLYSNLTEGDITFDSVLTESKVRDQGEFFFWRHECFQHKFIYNDK